MPNKIEAVTFAALGSADSIERWAREQRLQRTGLEEFVAPRLINYVRRGDGFTYRAAVGPDARARVLGSIVDLEPFNPYEIQDYERALNLINLGIPESLFELLARGALSAPIANKLLKQYMLNHDHASFYDPSFTSPLESAIHQGYMRRQRQGAQRPLWK